MSSQLTETANEAARPVVVTDIGQLAEFEGKEVVLTLHSKCDDPKIETLEEAIEDHMRMPCSSGIVGPVKDNACSVLGIDGGRTITPSELADYNIIISPYPSLSSD